MSSTTTDEVNSLRRQVHYWYWEFQKEKSKNHQIRQLLQKALSLTEAPTADKTRRDSSPDTSSDKRARNTTRQYNIDLMNIDIEEKIPDAHSLSNEYGSSATQELSTGVLFPSERTEPPSAMEHLEPLSYDSNWVKDLPDTDASIILIDKGRNMYREEVKSCDLAIGLTPSPRDIPERNRGNRRRARQSAFDQDDQVPRISLSTLGDEYSYQREYTESTYSKVRDK